MYTQIGRAMAAAAAWTGTRLEAGAAAGVPQQEETITESVLLDLALGSGYQVEMFTRREETVIGADWLWWLQDPYNGLWIGLLIQAKRLYTAGDHPGMYALGQRPSAPGSRRQVETLIRTARWAGTPALYALYNASRHTVDASEPCPMAGALAPEPLNGITFIAAATAAQLCSHLKPSVVHVPVTAVKPFAEPWSCLLTCDLDIVHGPGYPRFSGPSRFDPLQKNLAELTFRATPGPARDAALALIGQAVRIRAPQYVTEAGTRPAAFAAGQEARTLLESLDEERQPELMEGAESIPPNVSYVAIARRE